MTPRPKTQHKDRHWATHKRGQLLIETICHTMSGRLMMDITEVPLGQVGTEQDRQISQGNLLLSSSRGYTGEGLNNLGVIRPHWWAGSPTVGNATCAP